MICTGYHHYATKGYVEMCESYGFDLNKATRAEIGQRAIELCDEFAEKYPQWSTEHIAFLALKANWARTNETRK